MPDLSPSPQTLRPSGSRFFSEYYAAAFLFLLCLFIAGAFVVLRPLLIEIKQINAETVSRLEAIEQERRYLSSLEQSIAAAKSIPATTLDQVNKALPKDPNIPSLLLQFGVAAARHHVRIDSLSFNPTHAVSAGTDKKTAFSDTVLPLDVTLALRVRSYPDVKRFLTEIESSLRLMDVMGIVASGVGDDLTYTLQLRTYTFAPPAPPGGVKTPRS